MSVKFGRNYRLTVDANDGGSSLVIEPPLTLKFTLNRSTLSSLNTADISIYNLGELTRGKVYRDRYNPFVGQGQRLKLEAGYGTELSLVFSGSVFEANYTREGVNIVTNIHSRDGGFDVTGTTTNRTMKAGSSVYDVIQSLINDFKAGGGTIDLGVISPEFKKQIFSRPVVLNGNTFDLIQKYADRKAYVDLEKVYVKKDNEVIVGGIPLISSVTGLIGTPRREDASLTVTTLFEPNVLMGQKVQLLSQVAKVYDGVYEVIGVQHQGVISGAEGGSLYSTFTLLAGSKLFGEVKTIGQPSINSAAKPYTPTANTDLDNLSKTLYGEARGEGSQGMQAVANVVTNRTKAEGFPSTVTDVVLQKSQFSVWNPITGGSSDSSILTAYNNMISVQPSDASYSKALGIADRAIKGTLPDITNGATHYYTGAKPYWADSLTVTAVIGNHTFLK